MKKRESRFEKSIKEAYHIGQILQQQGKTDAERSAYQLIAATLLSIEDTLLLISRVLFCLLGLVVGKIVSGLL